MLIALSYISFLHQTTTSPPYKAWSSNCLISLFYIKPQQESSAWHQHHIVLYLFSTSNHNVIRSFIICKDIVLYLFSTSNHNECRQMLDEWKLSYISFLHQTTTDGDIMVYEEDCLISLFYIKPQRNDCSSVFWYIVLYLFSTSNHNRYLAAAEHDSIVLYLFSTSNHNQFIFPEGHSSIVLYLFSTSNHNQQINNVWMYLLSYISFLHQTTTLCISLALISHCLISLFYIKPQLSVASYPKVLQLSYISFLHQTTTETWQLPVAGRLSYISFLHQTTT